MTGKPLCAACAQPVADQARICKRCSDRLARDLGDVQALTDELAITRSRQSRTGGGQAGIVIRTEDRPLPWDELASETTGILRSTLVGWTRIVCEERGKRPPADTLPDMAAFLLSNLEWLRHHAAGEEAADEIDHAVHLARRTIDRKPELAYFGPCRGEHDAEEETGAYCCLAELYVRAGVDSARCRTCGTEHDVITRREWLLEEARNMLAPVRMLVLALSRLGMPLNEGTVNSWVSRDRLVAHGLDHAGRPTYRVGDVLDLMAQAAAEAERRRQDTPKAG